jgi:hypothetical protein
MSRVKKVFLVNTTKEKGAWDYVVGLVLELVSLNDQKTEVVMLLKEVVLESTKQLLSHQQRTDQKGSRTYRLTRGS